jgi:hypothetical protein
MSGARERNAAANSGRIFRGGATLAGDSRGACSRPLVILLRLHTAAKVDSMGFVVRRCTQRSARKS